MCKTGLGRLHVAIKGHEPQLKAAAFKPAADSSVHARVTEAVVRVQRYFPTTHVHTRAETFSLRNSWAAGGK